MATISKALLDLLTNPKTQNFAKSLKHSDLPTGWADDPEIVDLAAKAWQEAGTDSPFFKAWFGGSKVVDDAGNPLVVKHWVNDFHKKRELTPEEKAIAAPWNKAFQKTISDYKEKIAPVEQAHKNDFFNPKPYTQEELDVLKKAKEEQNAAIEALGPNPLEGIDTSYVNPNNFEVFDKKLLGLNTIENASDPNYGATSTLGFWSNVGGDNALAKTFDRPREFFLKIKTPSEYNALDDLAYDIKLPDKLNLSNEDIKKAGRDYARQLKNDKYDGIFTNDEEFGGKSFVAFNPNQMKSLQNRGTFNPKDNNVYRTLAPLGVGTAAMAAALLGDGSDAEAAPMKLPPEVQRLVHQLGKRKPSSVDLGPMQDDIFASLQSRNEAYQLPELFASANDIRHLQKSRMEKPRANQKMTPEEIGAMVNSLQNSTRARVVTGKDAYPDAVIVPHGEQTYLGVYRPEDDGRAGLQTAYAPKTKALPNKLGSAKNPQTTFKDWVDANLPSNYAPRSMGGREFTQRQLSAVEPLQVAAGETLPEVASSVNKKIIPAALLAAALGGDAAQAIESNEPSASSGGNLRALGIGARDVLEGMGEGVGFVANPFANLLNAAAGGSPTYFSEANAGRALADLLGLPAAESDAEKFLGGISRGAASVLPTMGAGVALNAAKAAPLLANDLLASPRMQAAFGAGIGGFDQALRYLLDGD